MLGNAATRRHRTRFVTFVLADNQNRAWLAKRGKPPVLVSPGRYFARVESDEPLEDRRGVYYWRLERGVLVATNHGLFTARIGSKFSREEVPNR